VPGEGEEVRLQPGVAFHLTESGQWKAEEVPERVLGDASVSGHITIQGFRCTVFETSDKDQWAQKSPIVTSSVAKRVAARWLRSKGKDVTSLVKKIMDRPGDDKDTQKAVSKYGKRVRKSIPKAEDAFHALLADLERISSDLSDAGHDKVSGHHAAKIRDEIGKAVSTVQVAAKALSRNLGKHAEEWDPED
jgi:hypothetical protein